MTTGQTIALIGGVGGTAGYLIARNAAKKRGYATTAIGATLFGVPHRPKGRGMRVDPSKAVAAPAFIQRMKREQGLSAEPSGNFYYCTCPNGNRILCGGGESCDICCKRHALRGVRSAAAPSGFGIPNATQRRGSKRMRRLR